MLSYGFWNIVVDSLFQNILVLASFGFLTQTAFSFIMQKLDMILFQGELFETTHQMGRGKSNNGILKLLNPNMNFQLQCSILFIYFQREIMGHILKRINLIDSLENHVWGRHFRSGRQRYAQGAVEIMKIPATIQATTKTAKNASLVFVNKNNVLIWRCWCWCHWAFRAQYLTDTVKWYF